MRTKIWFYSVIALHMGVMLFFWWTGSGHLLYKSTYSIMLTLGRLLGLILVSLALLQLLIMSRAPWIEQAFGLDKLARVHHRIGKYFIIPLILHPLFILLSYSGFAETGIVSQYFTFLKNDDLLQATIAFLLFFGIIVYSILHVWKKWNFERWYYTHIFMYAAILLAFSHQTELGGDFANSTWFTYYWDAAYIFTLFNLGYFRFLKPYLLFRKHQFTVSTIAPETADVRSVYITGKRMDQYPICAGQFMIVRFIQKGFWWQAHPFSLSKYPDGKELRLSIKASGDFSSTVGNIAPGTKVIIEGPYGVFTAQHSKTNKVLLIAGGIGITPYQGMLEDLGRAGKDIVLIYGNKTEADIALRKELEELSGKYNIHIHHVLSNQDELSLNTSHSALCTFSSGFVTPELIQRLVPDVASREIFLCGPPPMLNVLIKSLPQLGVPKNKIYFEKFSL